MIGDFAKAIAASGNMNSRRLGQDPFSVIKPRPNGGATRICGFSLDSSCVSSKSIESLKKSVKYIPLNELTPSACSMGSYFTVACVCGIDGDRFYLSDLRTEHRILIAPPDRCVIKLYDVIAIANAKIHEQLEAKEAKHIIQIGHINEVQKCSHYGHAGQCSGFVDPRRNPLCDSHCELSVENAGKSRAFLKQGTKFNRISPESSPERESIFARKPLGEIPQEFINQYLGEHPYGRGAKMAKALDRKESPIIGLGFNPGDIMLL